MFDWLFEGLLAVYLLLLLLAAGIFVLWRRNGERRFLYVLGGIGLLALAYFLLDKCVETDREQIQRKVVEIGAALTKPDLDRVFAHVSESFHLGNDNKKAMRQRAEGAIKSYNIHNLKIWGTEIGTLDRDSRKAAVSFFLKADSTLSSGAKYLLCRSEFVLDPDDQWRMKTFALFNPYSDSETPFPIPP